MLEDRIVKYREFMKANFEVFDEVTTDQQLKKPYPPLYKPASEGDVKISLPEVDGASLDYRPIFETIANRSSVRKYSNRVMTLEELSYLLYATQGVRKHVEGKYSFRTVPSGGARHPFETYLTILNVAGVEKGLYRYQAFSNELVLLKADSEIGEKTTEGALGQAFTGKAAVNFIWTCIPYRGEWRYDIAAHKTMLLDAGHLCQNLYLACESIDYGTCAIAAYDQEKMDALIGVDGIDEFVVYMSPVGCKE